MKDNKKKKKQEQVEEPQRPKKERVEVWVPVSHKNLTSSHDIEWPEFTSEKERIRANSLRFKNTPISEAMCGISETSVEAPEIPVTPVIGSIFNITVNKHGKVVSFSGFSSKETIVCRNNLTRYTNLELTNRVVAAKVVAHDKLRQTVTIDILQPMFEEWVNAIVADKTIQYNVKAPKTVTVHNLKLANGGFIGKAEVPLLSEFVGEPYTVDAFIPGSQIVLNIEEDFEKWNGKTVDTFIAGYTTKPGSVNQMSLICSRKALLNFSGNLSKIQLFSDYCENNKKWKAFTKSEFVGTITGVIDSSKKTGVFVEIPLFNITGMISTEAKDLVNFKKGAEVKARITDFEQMLTYNPTNGNTEHAIPYVIEDGCLKSCILKPVLELA